uniref:Uncharacterized protein n=1 Tax=Pyricularia oryzae (strain P131) TaxID=1143193 RepID=L7IW38_PYRO1
MSTRQDERLMNTLESTGVQPALPVSNVLVAAQTDVGGDRSGKAAVCSTLQRRIGLASSVIAAPEETAPGTGCELRWGRTRIKSRWCGRVPGLQRCTGIGRSNEYKERRRSTKSPHRCRQIPVNCKEVPVISVIISTKCNGFNCHEGFAVVANCWRHLAQGIAYEVAAT